MHIKKCIEGYLAYVQELVNSGENSEVSLLDLSQLKVGNFNSLYIYNCHIQY